jgi:hypothetical protein
MITPISLNGTTISVVSLPASPGLQSVDFDFTTLSAVVTSVFTGQQQTQKWPGADMWTGTATLPPLIQAEADVWIAALMQMQGQVNAFQIGDPLKSLPRGVPLGTPVADGSVAMTAGTNTLNTKGWTASKSGLLLPGDYLQIGFRLHRVLDSVTSDSSGKAAINIWPSLREVPLDSQPIITTNPVGLFRLAKNKNTWSSDYTSLSHMSFQFQEYR